MKKMNVLQAPFVEEMVKTTKNLYRLGWDERNGGNISYLLKEEEITFSKSNTSAPKDSNEI